MKKMFKDQCDICNKFNYCKGFDGLVLCEKCISKSKLEFNNKPKKDKIKDSEIIIIKGQTSIYDYL